MELTCSVEDALQMLAEGELDCYLALDSYSDSAHNIPLCRIGASDFFFVVAQERSDLLSELNSALTKINNEDRNFNTQLYAKYNLTSDANLVMSETDRAWLRDHGPIRVGYQDNYLAFCASDSSGSLTGALNEYLNYAADCIEDTHLDFETVAYPHVEDAMQALQKGEIDCVFPANLSYYDSETMGVVMTPALMRSEMLAVVRETEQRSFVTKQQVTVAVNSGNTNYDKFLLDHFPDWQISYFDDTADCLEAVAHDEVDRYVWREVASQMQKWVEKYGRVFPVSVNVSRIDLYDPEFSTNIAALLKEFHIRREDFLLEITESAYTENSEQIVENVKKLREAGFFIEMDDFGSGYSSLNMISTLPIDIIKLDMEFIRNAFQGRSDTRMLEAVLGIAEMLYLPTVAEGVETQQQMQALRSMGCDVIQGYYFSKPVPAEEYEAFIEKRLSVPGEIPPVERSHHLPHLSDEDYSYDELHDPVTGLYNAPAFRLLAKDADQYHTALLLSEVVAEQGQDVTEQMIRHTAELLRRSFRPVDHICRIGNARFAIIMSRVDRSMQVQVEQKVARINDQLGSPEQQIPAVSLAVGVAFADRLAPGESILADAESALNGLLERGETGCAFH